MASDRGIARGSCGRCGGAGISEKPLGNLPGRRGGWHPGWRSPNQGASRASRHDAGWARRYRWYEPRLYLADRARRTARRSEAPRQARQGIARRAGSAGPQRGLTPALLALEDGDGAGPAGRSAADLDREAADREAVARQRLEVVQLLEVAVADLAAGLVAFPDQAGVAGFLVLRLGVDERR